MAPKKRRSAAITPVALLNGARHFYEIGELAYGKFRNDAVYFQYFQTTELLLKAYLQAHNRTRSGHDLEGLYKECRSLGLRISPDDRFELENIVNLLKLGNKNTGFRYFNIESRTFPDLDWTREVVGQLLHVVDAFVQPNGPAPPGKAVKIDLIIGKPV